MQTNIERINTFIQRSGLSVRKFEQSIGASNGAIGRAISKKSDINSTWMSKIIEAYSEINPEWLLSGVGNMLKDEHYLSHKNENLTLGNNQNMNTDFESHMNTFPQKDEKTIDYMVNNQQATAYWNFINKLHHQNNSDNLITPVSNAEEIFLKAYSIVSHYGLVNQTHDFFEKYYTKQIDKEQFEQGCQRAFNKSKELDNILKKYSGMLNELSDKLNHYNQQHDNIETDPIIGL